MITDKAIRERSYLIWEREGRPQGRNLEHWLAAKAEIEAEPSMASRSRAKPAASPRKRGRPAATKPASAQ